MRTKTIWLFALILTATLAAVTCGDSSSPTTPSPSPAPAPTPAPTPTPSPTPAPTPAPAPAPTATVTISNSGVSPKSLTISRGTRVTFVNNSNQVHDMSSDPHPEHTDCPAINDVGFLSAGQTKLTGNLNVARTCGYHDHNQPFTESLKGTIVIQ